MKDVHDEINAIRRKYNIPSMRAKPVQVTLLLLCCPHTFQEKLCILCPRRTYRYIGISKS